MVVESRPRPLTGLNPIYHSNFRVLFMIWSIIETRNKGLFKFFKQF